MLGGSREAISDLLQRLSQWVVSIIQQRRDEFFNFGGPREALGQPGHLEDSVEISTVTGETRTVTPTHNSWDLDGEAFEQYKTVRRSLIRIGYQRLWDEAQRRDGLKLNDFVYLQDLPPEILTEILKLVLRHPTAVRVNADFSRFDISDPLDLDYRILHANRSFYQLGLPLYYSLNEFSIHLSSFIQLDGFSTGGLQTAELSPIKPFDIIRRLKIVAEKGSPFRTRGDVYNGIYVETLDIDGPNLWIMMYAFRKLDKLTFDARSISTDWKHSYDELMENSWITIPANDELAALLRIGGIRADKEGIWVGHYTAIQAHNYMTKELIPELRETLEMLISTEQQCFFVVDESRVLD